MIQKKSSYLGRGNKLYKLSKELSEEAIIISYLCWFLYFEKNKFINQTKDNIL